MWEWTWGGKRHFWNFDGSIADICNIFCWILWVQILCGPINNLTLAPDWHYFYICLQQLSLDKDVDRIGLNLFVFQAKQSLATLTKDVPKRHSLAMPTETVVNGNQEWAMHAELPLTAAIRQSQQNLYHSMDRQGTHTYIQQRPVCLKI